MSKIAVKNATNVQMVTIKKENYIKYSALDPNNKNDLRSYLVKSSTQEVLLNPDDIPTGNKEFIQMKILDLPKNDNDIVVGYFTYTPKDGYKYLQSDIATGKTETFPLTDIQNSQSLKFESWDANGLKGNDMMLCFAYTSDKTTYVHEVYGNGVQQISSFSNVDNYPFHTLFVGRGVTKNVNKILLPSGSQQSMQPQNAEIALVRNNLVQNPEQIQSLGCFLISSNELSRSPINLNVTSFLPLNETDNVTTSNFNVTYKRCQASYDANIIVMMIEISFDETDKDGKVARKVKNMMVQSSNCGRDYFPTILNNNIFTNEDKDTVFMDNNLSFMDITSTIRLQNDMTFYPFLINNDALSKNLTSSLESPLQFILNVLVFLLGQDELVQYQGLVAGSQGFKQLMTNYPYKYAFICRFPNGKYLHLLQKAVVPNLSGSFIQTIETAAPFIDDKKIPWSMEMNINKYKNENIMGGGFQFGAQNGEDAIGVAYSNSIPLLPKSFEFTYFHQSGYQKKFTTTVVVDPVVLTFQMNKDFLFGVQLVQFDVKALPDNPFTSTIQLRMIAFPLKRDDSGIVTTIGDPLESEIIPVGFPTRFVKGIDTSYILTGKNNRLHMYLVIGFNLIFLNFDPPKNNDFSVDVKTTSFDFSPKGKSDLFKKYYQDTSKENSNIYILTNQDDVLSSYVITPEDPNEVAFLETLDDTAYPIESFFTQVDKSTKSVTYSILYKFDAPQIIFDLYPEKYPLITQFANEYSSKIVEEYDRSSSIVEKVSFYKNIKGNIQIYYVHRFFNDLIEDSKVFGGKMSFLEGKSEFSPYIANPGPAALDFVSQSLSNFFLAFFSFFKPIFQEVAPYELVYGGISLYSVFNVGVPLVRYITNSGIIKSLPLPRFSYQTLQQIKNTGVPNFLSGGISKENVTTVAELLDSLGFVEDNDSEELRKRNLSTVLANQGGQIQENNLPIYLQKYIYEGDVEITYGSIGLIPSNKINNRVLSINLSGEMNNNSTIVINFSNVDYKDKNQIKLEGPVSGIFTLCGHNFTASKIVQYTYSDLKLSLSINVPSIRTSTKKMFSLNITINDTGGPIPAKIGQNELSVPNENNRAIFTQKIPISEIMYYMLNDVIYDNSDSSLYQRNMSFLNILYGYVTFYMKNALNFDYPNNYKTMEERNNLTINDLLKLVLNLPLEYPEEYLNDAYYYAIYNFQNPFNYSLFEQYAALPTTLKSLSEPNFLPVSLSPEKDIKAMNIGNGKDIFYLYLDEDKAYVVDILSSMPEKTYPSVPLATSPTGNFSLITNPYNLNFALVDSENIDITVVDEDPCTSTIIDPPPLDLSSSQSLTVPFLSSISSKFLPYLNNFILSGPTTSDDANTSLYFLPNTDGSFKIAWKSKQPEQVYYFYYRDGDRILSYTTDVTANDWVITNPSTGNSTTIIDKKTGVYLGYNYILSQFVLTSLDESIPVFANTNLYWTIQSIGGGLNKMIDSTKDQTSAYTLKNNFTNTIATIFKVDDTTFQIGMSFATNNTLSCFYLNDQMTSFFGKNVSLGDMFPLPTYTNTVKNNLQINKILQVGAFLTSSNAQFSFVVEQNTFNLVIYNNLTEKNVGSPLYEYSGNPVPNALLTFQPDGNLVYSDGDRVLWGSGTTNKGGFQFILQNNGQLVILNEKGDSAIWKYPDTPPSDDSSDKILKKTIGSSKTTVEDLYKIIKINTTLTSYSLQPIQTIKFENSSFSQLENAYPVVNKVTKAKLVVPASVPGVNTITTNWNAFVGNVPVSFSGFLNQNQVSMDIPISSATFCVSSDKKIASINAITGTPTLTVPDDQKKLTFDQSYTFEELNITYPLDTLNQLPKDPNAMKQVYESSIRNTLYFGQSLYSKSRQYRLTLVNTGLIVSWKDPSGKENVVYAIDLSKDGVCIPQDKCSTNPCVPCGSVVCCDPIYLTITDDGNVTSNEFLIYNDKDKKTDVRLTVEDSGSLIVTGKVNGEAKTFFSSDPGPKDVSFIPYPLENFYGNTIFSMVPSNREGYDGWFYFLVQSTIDNLQYAIGIYPNADSILDDGNANNVLWSERNTTYVNIENIETQGVLFKFERQDGANDGKFFLKATLPFKNEEGLPTPSDYPIEAYFSDKVTNNTNFLNGVQLFCYPDPNLPSTPFEILNANGDLVKDTLPPYTPFQMRYKGSILQYNMCTKVNSNQLPSLNTGVFRVYSYGATANQFKLKPNFTGNNFVTWEVDPSGVPLGQSVKFQIQNDTVGLSVVDSKIQAVKSDPSNSYFQFAISFFNGFYRIFFLKDDGSQLYWYYDQENNQITLKQYDESQKENFAFRLSNNLIKSNVQISSLSIWHEPYIFLSCYLDGKIIKFSLPDSGDVTKPELTLAYNPITPYSYLFSVSNDAIVSDIKSIFDNSKDIFPGSVEVDTPWLYQVAPQFYGGFSFTRGTVYGYDEDFSSFFVWQDNNEIYYYANAYPGTLPTYNTTTKKFESRYSLFTNYNSQLGTDESLNYCEFLASPNRMYIVIVQNNENLCIYDYTTFINEQTDLGSFEGCNFVLSQTPVWMANVNPKGDDPEVRLTMQADGNLVLYGKNNKVLWATDTFGTPANTMELTNDGTMIVFEESTRKIYWTSKTGKEDGSRTFTPYSAAEPCIPIWSETGPASKKEGSGTTLIFKTDGNLVYTTNYPNATPPDPSFLVFETRTDYGNNTNKELLNCDWNQTVKQSNAYLQMYDNFYKNNIKLPEGLSVDKKCNVLYIQPPPLQKDSIYRLYVTYTDDADQLICCPTP